MTKILIITRDRDPSPNGPDTVGASASVLVSMIVCDMIGPAMRIENGAIVIEKWGMFRAAVAIEVFAITGGLLPEEADTEAMWCAPDTD